MTMIERVARALAASDGAKFHVNPDVYLTLARAAIEAMREPTEHMLDYGACHEDQDHDIFDEGHISREVWQAMIDAALAEKEE